LGTSKIAVGWGQHTTQEREKKRIRGLGDTHTPDRDSLSTPGQNISLSNLWDEEEARARGLGKTGSLEALHLQLWEDDRLPTTDDRRPTTDR